MQPEGEDHPAAAGNLAQRLLQTRHPEKYHINNNFPNTQL